MAFLTLTDILVLAFGCVVLLAWLILFFVGKKDASMFDPLEEKDFPVKDIYFIGYALIRMLNLQYRGKRDRRLRKELSILYGEKYVDYYLRVTYSQQISMSLTVLALAAPLYFFTEGSLLMFAVIILGAAVAFRYYGDLSTQKIKERSEKLLSDFSDVVSKLALLVNSGMILREAWERTAYSREGEIYDEMRRSVIEMQNGRSEVDALFPLASVVFCLRSKSFPPH